MPMTSDAPRCPLVIVTDAHISESQGNTGPFFEMLAVLEQGVGDVVFLGDIFDLWISLPRYEDALHRRFLSWCQRQKAQRRIGFVHICQRRYMLDRHYQQVHRRNRIDIRENHHIIVTINDI